MNVCSRHWERLRQLVCERGLGHLIHQPHDEFEEFAAELCGRHPQPAFDPMRAARATAIDFARKVPAAHQDVCAVCALIRAPDGMRFTFGISAEAYWPAVIVADVVEQARQRGLTPRAA